MTIINEDTESGIAYLDTENLKKGDTLLLPESSDTMDLLKTEASKEFIMSIKAMLYSSRFRS